MTRETFAADVVLIAEGGGPRLVYFPLTGVVSSSTRSGGKVSEGPIIGLETGVGLLDAMEEEGRSTRRVRLAGEFISIPADVFRRRVIGSRELALVLLRDAAEQLERAEKLARCGAIHGAHARTARVLLEFADRLGRSAIQITQAQLAAIVGAPRTSVSGCVAALRREGLISLSGSEITIQDRPALLARACACHRALSTVAKAALSLTTRTFA